MVGKRTMAHSLLVIAEQGHGGLHRMTWEALSAGRSLSQGVLTVAVLGRSVASLAEAVAAGPIDSVCLVEHDLLEHYTPEAYTMAIRQLILEVKPDFVIAPHTYQARDFVPRLAASFRRSVVSDCVGIELDEDRPVFIRQLFSGRVLAETLLVGAPPYFITLQANAFSNTFIGTNQLAPIRRFDVSFSGVRISTRNEPPLRTMREAIDLTKIPAIVAVGRGIRAPEHIEMARRLASLLGGEVAATRPVCDEGWLPMAHQVGSSGQTVAPKLYLALGLSGATQHVVGMRGSGTIIAINKDPNAPIFKIADYGIVGDLFEIVPVLIDELQSRQTPSFF